MFVFAWNEGLKTAWSEPAESSSSGLRACARRYKYMHACAQPSLGFVSSSSERLSSMTTNELFHCEVWLHQHITSEATSFRVFDCRCGLHGQSQICVPDNTWLCGYTCRAFSCNLAIPASRELTIRPCIMMVISVWRAADKLQHIRVPSVRTERR